MPEPIDLKARQVVLLDDDGVQAEVEVIEPLLGLTPYVLMYCDELDPRGAPVFTLRFGGGLGLEQIVPLMKSLCDNLSADLAAGLVGPASEEDDPCPPDGP